MAKKSEWFNNIARIVKKKNGGYFLSFERQKNKEGEYLGESPYPIVINEGDIFQARTKKEDLGRLVELGKMSQEAADRICENVKFEMSIPPKKDEDKASVSQSESTPVEDDDVF
jgi:hypothetical protein